MSPVPGFWRLAWKYKGYSYLLETNHWEFYSGRCEELRKDPNVRITTSEYVQGGASCSG